MMQFLAISEQDPMWETLIARAYSYDFYHTQSYHNLEDGGKAVLAAVFSGEDFIAMPFIVRAIPDSDLFDCTSAYGYCGPVTSKPFDELPSGLANFFRESVIEWFASNRIVAAFSRLHPLIPHEVLSGFGSLRDVNHTVAIDLRLTPEEQYRQYRKSNKSEINQLRRNGFEVIEATDDAQVRAFAAIYNETMSRVNASKYYFFTYEYFRKFLDNRGYESRLMLATKDGTISAGALFTYTGSIIQYHLAGTTAEFMRDTPMKLILDEVRRSARADFRFLHLGGGVGGSDEDSLFRFKAGFSDFRCIFRTWQYIAQPERYEQLVNRRNPDRTSLFFPLYRAAPIKDV